jgi:hypothetical protein
MHLRGCALDFCNHLAPLLLLGEMLRIFLWPRLLDFGGHIRIAQYADGCGGFRQKPRPVDGFCATDVSCSNVIFAKVEEPAFSDRNDRVDGLLLGAVDRAKQLDLFRGQDLIRCRTIIEDLVIGGIVMVDRGLDERMRRWRRIFRTVFWAFNLFMLAWIAIYWGILSGVHIDGPHPQAAKIGAAIGGTIGTGVIMVFWAMGAFILGMLVLFTRGRKTVIEERID